MGSSNNLRHAGLEYAGYFVGNHRCDIKPV
jgi:hypothetical protein